MSFDNKARLSLGPCISPASFWLPDHIPPISAWLEHAPFAFWLMGSFRPRTLVELGTHYGFSYFCFCQAVERLHLETCCYAVDTWKGDDHAGFYGENVFREVNDINQQRYSAFSSLIRSTFDEASRYFADGTIDLLHIDGRHFVEDARHDFETWRAKLSNRAIVLFHDINVREREFGVCSFWRELCDAFPYFEFMHGHGLGVLGIGSNLPEPIQMFLAAQASPEAHTGIQRAYARLGWAVTSQFRAEQLRIAGERSVARLTDEIATFRQTLAAREADVADLNQALSERNDEIRKVRLALAELNQKLVERGGQIAARNQTITDRDAKIAALSQSLMDKDAKSIGLDEKLSKLSGELIERETALAECVIQLSQLQETISLLHASKSWRITAALRFVTRQFGRLGYSAAGYPITLCWQALRSRSRAPFRKLRATRVITRSGLFDRKWYKMTNPDVAACGIDPVRHYVAFGASERRDPSPSFSTKDYLSRYPGVAAAGCDPLSHFILYGTPDERVPHHAANGGCLR
jgi:hypothetical protein